MVQRAVLSLEHEVGRVPPLVRVRTRKEGVVRASFIANASSDSRRMTIPYLPQLKGGVSRRAVYIPNGSVHADAVHAVHDRTKNAVTLMRLTAVRDKTERSRRRLCHQLRGLPAWCASADAPTNNKPIDFKSASPSGCYCQVPVSIFYNNTVEVYTGCLQHVPMPKSTAQRQRRHPAQRTRIAVCLA
jgi:hypothetical protein